MDQFEKVMNRVMLVVIALIGIAVLVLLCFMGFDMAQHAMRSCNG